MVLDVESLMASGPKFTLGRLVATRNALAQISRDDIQRALTRHLHGDWGTVDAEDWAANNAALQTGGRLLSAYRSQQNVKFWIITEADRTLTTVLLPEDY